MSKKVDYVKSGETYYAENSEGVIAGIGSVYVGDYDRIIEISYHQGEMPAFNSENVDPDDIERKMREFEPDLRKWKPPLQG